MATPQGAILLNDSETIRSLGIELQELEFLVSTKQILPLFIRGARRFINADLQALVRTYQIVQNRS